MKLRKILRLRRRGARRHVSFSNDDFLMPSPEGYNNSFRALNRPPPVHITYHPRQSRFSSSISASSVPASASSLTSRPFPVLWLPRSIIVQIGDFLPDTTLSAFATTNRGLNRLLTPQLYDRLVTRPLLEGEGERPRDTRDFLLLRAVLSGSLVAATHYLRVGASPDTVDTTPQGWSVLQNAVAAEDDKTAVSLVSALVAAGANVCWRSPDGLTALHIAAWRGSVDVVRILAAVDVNVVTPSGETPLHFAAVVGDIAVVRVLLELGADPGAKDELGKTPLVCAGEIEAQECVAALATGRKEGLGWVERGLIAGVALKELRALAALGEKGVWEEEEDEEEVVGGGVGKGILKVRKKKKKRRK